MFKGTVSVMFKGLLIQRWKCLNYNSTLKHLKLIKNVEDAVVFMTRKVFISESCSIAS